MRREGDDDRRGTVGDVGLGIGELRDGVVCDFRIAAALAA